MACNIIFLSLARFAQVRKEAMVAGNLPLAIHEESSERKVKHFFIEIDVKHLKECII